jgi:hypothetical protein
VSSQVSCRLTLGRQSSPVLFSHRSSMLVLFSTSSNLTSRIEDLKELARKKFADAASFERNWHSSSFPYAANLVCESTPDVDKGLRTVVIETLNQPRELLDYEEVQELLGSRSGLALALLQTVLCEDRVVKVW